MTSFRDYKSQRPARIMFETITFTNETFGTIRLVADQIFPKTLGGNEYTPCRMSIVESQQSSTPVITSTVKFGRMAQDFKQQLKKWKAFGRITPIQALCQYFDAADVSVSVKSWTLYVSDVNLDATDVNVTVTLKNPLNSNVGILYTPEEFPGLQNA